MKLALVLVCACGHAESVKLTALPQVIVRHKAELLARGFAYVEVEQGGTARVQLDDKIFVKVPGHEHSHLFGRVTTGSTNDLQRLTIEELLTGCDAEMNGDECVARWARGEPITVGKR